MNWINILERYKNINGMEGNTPLSSNTNFSSQGSPYPENEDLNEDNTLSDLESYYEYEIDLLPDQLAIGKNNIVDKIIITDNTELYRIETRCKRCEHVQEKIIERIKVISTKTELQNSSCPSCKSTDLGISDQDIIDYIAILALKTGTSVEVISGVSEHGSMLASIGNLGAILRYNPNYSN